MNSDHSILNPNINPLDIFTNDTITDMPSTTISLLEQNNNLIDEIQNKDKIILHWQMQYLNLYKLFIQFSREDLENNELLGNKI